MNNNLLNLYTVSNLPAWIQRNISNYYTLAKRADIDFWQVQGDVFIWVKDGISYPCRNYQEVLDTTWNLEYSCSTSSTTSIS